MTLASPSPTTIENLIFGHDNSDSPQTNEDDSENARAQSSGENEDIIDRRSMYVKLFEEMLQTVIDTEPQLFAIDEFKAFENYDNLSYAAKYLFVRLSLRKTDKWIKFVDLKYENELGSDGILEAMKELCRDPLAELFAAAEDVKPNLQEVGPEIIDLAYGEDESNRDVHLDEDHRNENPPKPDYNVFAQDENHADLFELLGCLRTEDLKDLVKQVKARPKGNNRDALVDSLLSSTSTQQTLSFPPIATPSRIKGKAKLPDLHQKTLHGYVESHSPKGKKASHQVTLYSVTAGKKGERLKTAQDRLWELVMKKIVACIKLNEDIVRLFRRVNLVYFRSTVPTPLLTPSILVHSKKWSYAHQHQDRGHAPVGLSSSSPSFTPVPSSNPSSALPSASTTPSMSPAPAVAPGPSWARTQYKLWPTRDALLRYEWALELEARVDEIFGMAPSPGSGRTAASSGSRKGKERERAGSVLSTAGRTTPAISVAGQSSVSVSPEKTRHSVFSTTPASDSPRASRRTAASAVKDDGDALSVVNEDRDVIDGGEKARVRGAREVKQIFEEVWPEWLEIPEVMEELERTRRGAEGKEEEEAVGAQGEAEKIDEGIDMDEPEGGEEHAEEQAGEKVPKVKVEENWDVFARVRTFVRTKPPEDSTIAESDGEDGDIEGDMTKPENASLETDKWANRFHYGHVLTRIVCKGTHALSILKQHDRELEVLETLLAQRAFRRGRRGRWHERRALILMTHREKDEETSRRAWDAVLEALKDEDTHVVYRPKLLRRLFTLQKRLEQFGVSDINFVQMDNPAQRKPEETRIEGERIHATVDAAWNVVTSGKAAKSDGAGGSKRRKIEKDDGKQTKLPFIFAAAVPVKGPSISDVKPQSPTGKSVWRGRDGEEVNVETFALQHYEAQGFKGLHSEGRIVTTLFGLLFWDVIFAPVSGAFETPYQSAPLDIAEDSFYFARRALANARLKEIENGKGTEVFLRTWDAHVESKTFCVGVKWELLQRGDFVQIMECFDSTGLSIICRTLLEDYANRTGGLPDLFLWHLRERKCKFVEVKGPGDNLQENQKLWIDILVQAKVPVEVCHVSERGEPRSKGKGKGKAQPKKVHVKKSKTPTAIGKKRKRADNSEGSEEPIPPDSEGDVVSEVNYSQLDQAAASEDEVEIVGVRKAKEVKREPRRSSRPRKPVNYVIVLPIEDTTEQNMATVLEGQKVQEIRNVPEVQDSQELKRTQEVVTRPGDNANVEEAEDSTMSSTRRRTLSRKASSLMQVEMLLETPSPRKRKREESLD